MNNINNITDIDEEHDEKYNCDLCEYKTNDDDVMLTHIIELHNREINFRCNKCDHKTTKINDSDIHYVEQQSNGSSKAFTECKGKTYAECIKCDHKYTSYTYIINHDNTTDKNNQI